MDDFILSIKQKFAVIHKKCCPELNPKIVVSLFNHLCISTISEESYQSGKFSARVTYAKERLYAVPLVSSLTRNTVRRRRAERQETVSDAKIIGSFTCTGSQ